MAFENEATTVALATQATEAVQGTAKVATAAETTAGTDDLNMVTALKLQQKLDALPSSGVNTWWVLTTPNAQSEQNFTLASSASDQQQSLGVDMNPTPLTACMVQVMVEMMAKPAGSDTPREQVWRITMSFSADNDTPENRVLDFTITEMLPTTDITMTDILALSGGGGGTLEVGFTDTNGLIGAYNVYLKSSASEPKATP